MHKPQQQVREFQRDVIEGHTSPAEPMLREATLRAKLLIEEAIETVFALAGSRVGYQLVQEQLHQTLQKLAQSKASGEPNLVEAIDGLCDVLVIAYGTAENIGIDLEPFFDEVMRSNMAKKGGPLREDGKRLKPPGWTPPDLAGVLRRTLEGGRFCPRHGRSTRPVEITGLACNC